MAIIVGVTKCRVVTDYVESIRQAGGEPRVLDPEDDPPAIDGLDGILLTGGADIDPHLYGEEPHPTVVPAEDRRDDFELELARRAFSAGLPVLGICRGLQVMNVAFGGTLIQDIPSELSEAVPHSITTPKTALAHRVDVAPGSRLAGVLEHRLGDSVSCEVNSRHHQAPDAVAPGFKVVARSPDGVIEALEHETARFCLGVQWHPENFCATGEFSPLFEAFVKECARKDRT